LAVGSSSLNRQGRQGDVVFFVVKNDFFPEKVVFLSLYVSSRTHMLVSDRRKM
jgi:hypothetical protein